MQPPDDAVAALRARGLPAHRPSPRPARRLGPSWQAVASALLVVVGAACAAATAASDAAAAAPRPRIEPVPLVD